MKWHWFEDKKRKSLCGLMDKSKDDEVFEKGYEPRKERCKRCEKILRLPNVTNKTN